MGEILTEVYRRPSCHPFFNHWRVLPKVAQDKRVKVSIAELATKTCGSKCRASSSVFFSLSSFKAIQCPS